MPVFRPIQRFIRFGYIAQETLPNAIALGTTEVGLCFVINPTTAAATWSGSIAGLRRGAVVPLIRPVLVKDGSTAATRTFFGDSSASSASVNASTPALVPL